MVHMEMEKYIHFDCIMCITGIWIRGSYVSQAQEGKVFPLYMTLDPFYTLFVTCLVIVSLTGFKFISLKQVGDS